MGILQNAGLEFLEAEPRSEPLNDLAPIGGRPRLEVDLREIGREFCLYQDRVPYVICRDSDLPKRSVGTLPLIRNVSTEPLLSVIPHLLDALLDRRLQVHYAVGQRPTPLRLHAGVVRLAPERAPLLVVVSLCGIERLGSSAISVFGCALTSL